MPELGVRLVAPTVADAGRIATVINARSLALVGETEESAVGVETWFSLPNVDPATDMRLAIAGSGSHGGVRGCRRAGGRHAGGLGRSALPAGVRASPCGSCSSGRTARGAERVGRGGSIRFSVDAHDHALGELLAGAGYAVTRSSYTMERALAGELERPAWPPGIEVRPFDEEDAAALHAAENEAFADHWGYTPSSLEAWSGLQPGTCR